MGEWSDNMIDRIATQLKKSKSKDINPDTEPDLVVDGLLGLAPNFLKIIVKSWVDFHLRVVQKLVTSA